MLNKIREIFTDSDFSEILSKASFFLVFRGFAFLLGYAFALLVIKFYGVDVYGFVTLSFTILMMTSVISRFGLDVSLTKTYSLFDKSNTHSHYFYSILTTFFISLLIATPIYLFSVEISEHIFSKREFNVYLKWTAVSIPIWSLLLINTGVFRGLGKAKYYSTLDNFGRFLLSILILALYIYFDNTNEFSPIISHFLGLFFLLLISMFWIYKSIDIKKKLNFSKSRPFLISSFPIMLSSSIVIFLAWSDKILLGVYNTEENIAVYDIAVRIATLITFNLEAINSILASKISRYYKENQIFELNKVVQFSSKVNTILALGIFVILLLFSKTILGFFGEEFLTARVALIILAFGQMFNSFCGPVGNILHMTGNQKEFRNIMAYTLVINIILNLILIQKFGINGAAIATTFSLVFWNFFGVLLIRRKLGINSFYSPWHNLKQQNDS